MKILLNGICGRMGKEVEKLALTGYRGAELVGGVDPNGETASVSIDQKSLTSEALMVTAGSANMWGIVLIAVIPLAILIIGVVVWVQRRRR